MHWLCAFLLLLFSWALTPAAGRPTTNVCTAAGIQSPELFGAEIISLSAGPVTNYSLPLPQLDEHFALNITGLEFCNVSIQYTHPGQNDSINVQVWLPLNHWNERFMGTGGGGYATEIGEPSLAYAVSLGYSAVATDGGHPPDSFDPSSWALSSPGNINWALLQDFAAIALDDATTIGKAVTTSYYGSSPKYSYWNGCSTGGRQGLMMAQRYPSQYDGILAAAPAINWVSLIVAAYWPQLVMNQLGMYIVDKHTVDMEMLTLSGIYPPPCEFDALTAAATAACDNFDGVTDGIIAAPGLCNFDPHTVVGQTFYCTDSGTNRTISSEAATIALAAWTGPRSVDGKFEWYGLNKDASLTFGWVGTNCSAAGTCKGQPFPIASSWIQFFVQKDPSFDVTNISFRQYDSIFRQSNNQFASILSTSDPDLTDFREAGGKMITWHGLADQLIPPNGTIDYYQRVLALDSHAADYYRFFPAPGVAHCANGTGYYPASSLQSLVDWVEKDIAPETLNGTTLPDINGTVRQAPLCRYPQIAAYKGGDINVASSFQCQSSF